MKQQRAAGKAAGKRTCPHCGTVFICDLAAGRKQCWCTSYPPLMPLSEDARECLCPDCLKRAIQEKLDAEAGSNPRG